MAGFLRPLIPEAVADSPPPSLLAAIAERERRVIALRGVLEEILPDEGPLVVEIGCGHGHWLTSYAVAHPDVFCLGIDVLTRRIKLAEEKRQKRGLEHLRFLKAEALETLEALPHPDRVVAIAVLFPDPWPKARHHKNRLIQEDFLDLLARRFRPGLELWFRTDHREYFDWSVERIRAHPSWRIAEDRSWPHEERSYFQDLMDSWQSLVAVRIAELDDADLPSDFARRAGPGRSSDFD